MRYVLAELHASEHRHPTDIGLDLLALCPTLVQHLHQEATLEEVHLNNKENKEGKTNERSKIKSKQKKIDEQESTHKSHIHKTHTCTYVMVRALI